MSDLDKIRKFFKKAKRIDDLGRITIPKEIRDQFDTDYFLPSVENGKIILTPVNKLDLDGIELEDEE